MPPINRRDFVAAGAAASLPWASRTADAAGGQANLFDVLGKRGMLGGRYWRFIGADGQEVDIAALKEALKDSYTTAYIGFVGCDQYCPLTNHNMANLSAEAAKRKIPLKHIIINAVPEQQGVDPLREGTVDAVELTGLKPHRAGRALADSDAIVLFAYDGSGLNNALVPQISQALGNRTRLDSPTDHSPIVNVYAPGGAHVGRAMGTAPDVMPKLIEALSAQGRGRGG